MQTSWQGNLEHFQFMDMADDERLEYLHELESNKHRKAFMSEMNAFLEIHEYNIMEMEDYRDFVVFLVTGAYPPR